MDAGSPPKTLLEAVRYFADPDHALTFMVQMRWPDGEIACPTCGSTAVRFLKTRRLWKCGNDHKRRQFSIKVGTVMEDSPIGLDKWLPAIWLIVNCKNGISSYELARGLKITQKSAWFMLHRIRLAMQDGDGGKLGGPGKTVECDETWIGGKARSMNAARRSKAKKAQDGSVDRHDGKAIVLGMLERGGRIRMRVVGDVKARTLQPVVRANVMRGSNLHTDEAGAYVSISQPDVNDYSHDIPMGEYDEEYVHEAVNHAAEEYVRGNVHTNGIENFWSLLKRGIRGTYVSVEPFHLFRYLDEQAFRFNERKDKKGDGGRFVTALRQIVGKRLTYKRLIGMDDAALATT
jgi:transposase-like protein